MKPNKLTAELSEVAEIEFGTRITRKNNSGTIFPVYGGGGETFRTDEANREDSYIVSRFAMSEMCVRFVKGKFFLNDSGLTVRSKNEDLILQSYLDRFLLSNAKKIYKLGRGTAQKNLDIKSFSKLQISYPSIEEQAQIVNDFDNAKSAQSEYLQNLLQRKDLFSKLWGSIVNKVFSPEELFDADFVPLGKVAKLVGGGTPSKNKASYWGGDIPWASVRDLKSRFLAQTEFSITEKGLQESSSKQIPAGSLVIATRVGLGKAVQLVQDTAINQDLKAVLPKDPTAYSADFLYFWYLSKINEVVSAGTGATVQGVKIPLIESLSIPVVSIDVQASIVSRLVDLSSYIQDETQAVDAKILELEQLLQNIGKNYFGAKI